MLFERSAFTKASVIASTGREPVRTEAGSTPIYSAAARPLPGEAMDPMKSNDLIAVLDSELDKVAGGCLGSGPRAGGWLDWLAQIDIDLNIDIDIDIINFAGNVIQAVGGDIDIEIEPNG